MQDRKIKIKLRYLSKIPETQVGGAGPITIKKGDIVEVGELQAKVFLRDSKKWELVKGKKGLLDKLKRPKKKAKKAKKKPKKKESKKKEDKQ